MGKLHNRLGFEEREEYYSHVRRILLSILGCLALAPVAWAASPTPTPPLPDALERQVAAFAFQLTTPPRVVMVAELQPPLTVYGAELRDEAYERAIGELVANDLFTSTQLPGVVEWIFDISCGTVQNYSGSGATTLILLGRRVWSHPDGPGGCPHEEGTSHAGTIRVSGSYSMALDTSGQRLLEATWSYTCVYEGSEGGISECEEKLERWEGRYGTAVGGEPDDTNRPVTVIVGTIIILVAGIAVTLKVRRRHEEKGGWPTATQYEP